MFDRKLIYQTALMSLQWSSLLKAAERRTTMTTGIAAYAAIIFSHSTS